MGNSVRITRNHIYGNTTGISSDTLSAAGHPGFPADSSEIDNNFIYSNNLDLYKPNPPIKSLVPVPIGTGIIYPGMNDSRVHDNHIFDNWRDGVRLFAVPDALVNGRRRRGRHRTGHLLSRARRPTASRPPAATRCSTTRWAWRRPASPSRRRRRTSATCARRAPAARCPTASTSGGTSSPATPATAGSTTRAPTAPTASITGPGAGVPPDPLPSNCETSTGGGDVAKLAIELDCADGPDEDTGPLVLPLVADPAEAGRRRRAQARRRGPRAAKRFEQHRRGRQAARAGPRAVTQVAVRAGCRGGAVLRPAGRMR